MTDDRRITELLDELDANKADKAATVVRLVAELAVLEVYEDVRPAGHDYGVGQRRRALADRRRALAELGVTGRHAWPSIYTVTDPAALDVALRRVVWPQLRRLEREAYRARTAATDRTLIGWQHTDAVVRRRIAELKRGRPTV